MKVSAKTKEKPTPVEIEYDFPETLGGIQEQWGDEVTYQAAKSAIVISLQAFMRRLIEKDKSTAEIQAEASKWRPDVKTIIKQSAFEKATSSLDKLTPEERKILLEKLRAMPA